MTIHLSLSFHTRSEMSYVAVRPGSLRLIVIAESVTMGNSNPSGGQVRTIRLRASSVRMWDQIPSSGERSARGGPRISRSSMARLISTLDRLVIDPIEVLGDDTGPVAGASSTCCFVCPRRSATLAPTFAVRSAMLAPSGSGPSSTVGSMWRSVPPSRFFLTVFGGWRGEAGRAGGADRDGARGERWILG